MNYCKDANELYCSSTPRKVATALSAIVIIGLNIFAIALANSRSEDLRECQGNLRNNTRRLLQWIPGGVPSDNDVCKGKPCFDECESYQSGELLLILSVLSAFVVVLSPFAREGVKKVSSKVADMTVLFRSSNKPPGLIPFDIESQPVGTYGATD